MPVTRVGFGPFSFDPLEQTIGAKLADLMEPLMVGPVTRRPSEAGAAIEVYALALPEGEGASIPLGQWGRSASRTATGSSCSPCRGAWPAGCASLVRAASSGDAGA